MFKRQYRIQPWYIRTDGSVRYIAQTRIFPFWWKWYIDNTDNFIVRDSVEEVTKELSNSLEMEKRFNKEKEIHKNPL